MSRPSATASRKGRWLLVGLCIVSAQALLLLGAVLLDGESSPATTRGAATAPRTGAQDGAAHRGHDGDPPTLPEEMLYTYDIEDERVVIGLSENVFAGRVERVAGHESAKTTLPNDPGRPQTQLTVRVLAVAKASGPARARAGQDVTVNQEMGRDRRTGRVTPVEAAFCGRHLEDAPLEPGRHYVFATYYERARDLQTLTAQPTGAVPAASAQEAKTLLAAYERYEDQEVDPATGKIEGARPCE